MKSLFLLITLIVSSLESFGQSSTGRIVYQLQNTNTQNNQIVMWFTKDKYVYRFSTLGHGTVQGNLNQTHSLVKDSLGNNEISQELKKASEQYWFGDYGNNTVINSWYNPNTQKVYCIIDSIQTMDWEITADTMTINGVLCQKAIGIFNGMNYLAWFATNIPIPVAFMHYRGLPGLLVQCINQTRNSGFSMIELEWPLKTEYVFPSCTGSIVLTRKEANAMINKQNERAYKLLEEIKKNDSKGVKTNLSKALE